MKTLQGIIGAIVVLAIFAYSQFYIYSENQKELKAQNVELQAKAKILIDLGVELTNMRDELRQDVKTDIEVSVRNGIKVNTAELISAKVRRELAAEDRKIRNRNFIAQVKEASKLLYDQAINIHPDGISRPDDRYRIESDCYSLELHTDIEASYMIKGTRVTFSSNGSGNFIITREREKVIDQFNSEINDDIKKAKMLRDMVMPILSLCTSENRRNFELVSEGYVEATPIAIRNVLESLAVVEIKEGKRS